MHYLITATLTQNHNRFKLHFNEHQRMFSSQCADILISPENWLKCCTDAHGKRVSLLVFICLLLLIFPSSCLSWEQVWSPCVVEPCRHSR